MTEEIKAFEETTIVTKQYSKKGPEEHSEEKIRVRQFASTPATVSVKAGATVNMGNYESGRIDVMLTIPCYVEEIEDAFTTAKEWVDAKIGEEYNEMKASAGGA